MAGLLSRIRNAASAFRGRSDYIASVVRPYELNQQGWFKRHEYEQMLKRYGGWFKVATSRNAAAVGSLRCSVVRDSRYGKTAFKTRKPGDKLQKHMRESSGHIAMKAAYRAGENVEEIIDPNHPVVRLLDNPNPFMGYYELAEMTELMQGVCGDFGWYMVYGDNGWPVEIWPMYPQFVRVIADQQNIIKAYIYGRGHEVEQTFDALDVWFFKRPNPFGDPYRGLSDLYACAASVDLSAMFDSYAINGLLNAVQPGLIISDPALTPERQKIIYAELKRRAGTQNAAKDLLLQLGKEARIEKWESTGKEAGFLGGASDRATMEKIAAACDIPPDILVMGPTSLAHGETAMPHWMKYGVRPRANRYEDTINRNLARSFAALNDPSLFVVIEDPVSEDLTAVTAREDIQIKGGWGTVNEARAAVGKPPTTDPKHDELVDPNEVAKAKLEQEAKIAESNMAREDKASKDKANASAKRLTVKAITPPADGDEGKPAKEIGQVVFAWLTDIARRALESLPGHASQVESYSFVSPTDAMKLAERIVKPLTSGVQLGVEAGLAELPAGIPAFQIEQSRVQQYVEHVSGQLVQSVSKTVDDQIKQVLVEQLSGGTTGPELTQAVSKVLKDRTLADAERIAVTEASQTLHGGALIVWKASGRVKGKKWLLSGDPCPVCEAIARNHSTAAIDDPFVPLGATIKTIDGDFTVRYRDIQHPPAHPRCRCDMVPLFEGEDGEE